MWEAGALFLSPTQTETKLKERERPFFPHLLFSSFSPSCWNNFLSSQVTRKDHSVHEGAMTNCSHDGWAQVLFHWPVALNKWLLKSEDPFLVLPADANWKPSFREELDLWHTDHTWSHAEIHLLSRPGFLESWVHSVALLTHWLCGILGMPEVLPLRNELLRAAEHVGSSLFSEAPTDLFLVAGSTGPLKRQSEAYSFKGSIVAWYFLRAWSLECLCEPPQWQWRLITWSLISICSLQGASPMFPPPGRVPPTVWFCSRAKAENSRGWCVHREPSAWFLTEGLGFLPFSHCCCLPRAACEDRLQSQQNRAWYLLSQLTSGHVAGGDCSDERLVSLEVWFWCCSHHCQAPSIRCCRKGFVCTDSFTPHTATELAHYCQHLQMGKLRPPQRG